MRLPSSMASIAIGLARSSGVSRGLSRGLRSALCVPAAAVRPDLTVAASDLLGGRAARLEDGRAPAKNPRWLVPGPAAVTELPALLME
jgi:hypothetical protein